MKFRYLSLGVVALGFVIGGSASQANADIVDGGSGCSGTGDWDSGLSVDAATVEGVQTIPRSDTVHWEGSVKEGAQGPYNGSISVDLPPPFGEVLIDDWSGDYEEFGNDGDEEYDLPSLVPAGVEFKVHAEHTDKSGGCTGSVLFEIDGGPFDSSITFVAIGGTLFFFVGAGAALQPAFRRVG